MLSFLLALRIVTADKLLAVVEVCRHGARTPGTFYSWDNSTKWPEGSKQLIPGGMRQQYLLGYEFRQRYINNSTQAILSPDYKTGEIYVFSSDDDRCLQSAQSQIQGLYNLTGPNIRTIPQKINPVPPINVTDQESLIESLGLSALPNNTQVIPIHDDSSIRQYLVEPDGSCGYYMELASYKMSQTEALDEIYNQYPDVIATISEVMNWNSTTAKKNAKSIADSLNSNFFIGYDVPFNFSFYERVTQLALAIKTYNYFTPDFMPRLAGSPIMTRITSNFDTVIKGYVGTRFFLYSAHDTTISYILAYLGLDFSQPPPYASTLIFELYQTASSYYVTLKYNDVVQNISTCGGPQCPYATFKKFINIRAIPNFLNVCNMQMQTLSQTDTFPSNYTQFNAAGKDEDQNMEWYFWLSVAVYGFLLVVVFIIFILVCTVYKGKIKDSTNISLGTQHSNY
jgi:lysosomal acid phosphatase